MHKERVDVERVSLYKSKNMSKYTEDDLKVELENKEYEYGFYTELDSETFPIGLNEDIVRAISKKKEDGQLLSNTLAIMRTKEERPSVKDVKHSDEVERENFVMEKTEFLPNV